jgi:hypothetical protein
MTMTEVRNAQAKKTRCEGPLEAAYITAVLSLPLRLRRKLDLLIDTDSTKKAVFDKDAITIGIPFEKLNKSMESLWAQEDWLTLTLLTTRNSISEHKTTLSI